MRACNELGTAYGACVGQVTPIVENCSTLQDDDCDGLVNSHCAVWSEGLGGPGSQTTSGVAVDPEGNIVLVGTFTGTFMIGGEVLESRGGKDVFVAKLNPTGRRLWVRRFGDVLDQEARAVAVDSRGEVFITGAFAGTLELSASRAFDITSVGEADIFVIKLSSSGDVIGSTGLSGSEVQDARGLVALDGGGAAMVLVGDFRGVLPIGEAPPLSSKGGLDAFAVALGANGAPIWGCAFGRAGDDSAQAAAADSDGNVYITGYFHESPSRGGDGPLGKGGSDAFITKLSKAGDALWTRALGGERDERGASIAVRGASDVVVLGAFEGSVDALGEPLVSAGSSDLFLAKLSPSGAPRWARRFGGPGAESPGGLALNSRGDIVFGASFEGSADFGAGVMESAGATDVVVGAASGASGDLSWARRFGDFAAQAPRSVAWSGAGGALVAGDFAGGIDLGGGWMASEGGLDIFVAELAGGHL